MSSRTARSMRPTCSSSCRVGIWLILMMGCFLAYRFLAFSMQSEDREYLVREPSLFQPAAQRHVHRTSDLQQCEILVEIVSNSSFKFHVRDQSLRLIPVHLQLSSSETPQSTFECKLFRVFSHASQLRVPESPSSWPLGVPSSDQLPILQVVNSIGYVQNYLEAFMNRLHYAQSQGYPFLLFIDHVSAVQGRTPHYLKIPGLVAALQENPFVLFMDMDTYFDPQAFTQSLVLQTYLTRDFVQGDTEFIFGNWVAPYFNTGLMFLRNSPATFQFLDEWMKVSDNNQFQVHSYDQASFWHVLFLAWTRRADALQHQYPFRYTDQLVKPCSRGHSSCVKEYNNVLTKLFGFPVPHGAFQYPLLFTHGESPEGLDRDPTTQLILGGSSKQSTESLRVFHCMYTACKYENHAFVHHTGHTGWRKVRDSIPFVSSGRIES